MRIKKSVSALVVAPVVDKTVSIAQHNQLVESRAHAIINAPAGTTFQTRGYAHKVIRLAQDVSGTFTHVYIANNIGQTYWKNTNRGLLISSTGAVCNPKTHTETPVVTIAVKAKPRTVKAVKSVPAAAPVAPKADPFKAYAAALIARFPGLVTRTGGWNTEHKMYSVIQGAYKALAA